jgi:hypothetical protein
LAVLGAITVLTSALALWGLVRPGSPPIAARSSWRTTLRLTDTIATVERETFLSMSRDGSLLVFSGGWGPTRGLYLRRAGDERTTLIRGTEGAFVGAISPNGKNVAVKGPLGVTVVPIEGGTPRRVMMAELVTPFDWIDDEHLVVDQIDGLHRVPVAGGEMVRLTSVDTAAGEGYHVAPAALPDGAGVVFTVINTSSFDAAEMRIATVGPTGGVHVPLGQGAKAIFAPPGYLLIRTGTGSLDAQPFNPARRQATGRRQTILSGLTSGIFNNSGEFAVGADGHLVYITDPFEGDREVVTVSRNGAARSLPSGWIGNFESVSLSPDGRRIAAGTYTAANEEVQVRHLASGATTKISIPGAQLRDPAWAPSGDAIYFSALGTGHNGLYRVGLGAGAVAARVVTQKDLVLDQAAPSADGLLLYYTARGVNDIAFWEVAGSDSAGIVLERTSEQEVAPIPSPNGRWLAFWTLETGLMIRSADPARAERIVVYRGAYNFAFPRWSRDGTELFFSTSDSLMAVAVGTGSEFTMSTPKALFALGRLRPNFDVNATGEFIMVRHLVSRPNPPSLVLVADWKSLLRP